MDSGYGQNQAAWEAMTPIERSDLAGGSLTSVGGELVQRLKDFGVIHPSGPEPCSATWAFDDGFREYVTRRVATHNAQES